MDIAEILRGLRYGRGLPVEALRAAGDNRAAVLPDFLDEIERATAGNVDDAAAERLFFIFHLLGEWRERAAYRPLARLLRLPRSDVDRILGDAITCTSHRVMAAVFAGDPQPLYEIVLDRSADQFIRSRMCETVAMVTLRGAPPREEAADFLRRCWDELQPREDCFVWDGWQSAIAMLGLGELVPLVKMAFACGTIAKEWLSFKDFESDFAYAREHGGAMPHNAPKEYDLFGDTVEELSTWYGFSPRYEKDMRSRERAAAQRDMANETAVNLFPKVGRNEPCPCSSGKKFKKCCGQPAAMIA